MTYKKIGFTLGLKTSTVSEINYRWRKNHCNITNLSKKRYPSHTKYPFVADYAVQPRVLQEMAHLSMMDRVQLLRQMFRLRKLAKSTLHRIYKLNKISYRKANYCYQTKYKRRKEIQEKQNTFSLAVIRHLMTNKRVIFLDETTFNLWQ